MPKTDLTLYHYWRSSSSWRVRWGLNLKKAVYKNIAVDLLAGDEKKSAHADRNPAKYVPTLAVGSEMISESLAILEYLEETYPKPSFFTGDGVMRAKIRQLAESINSGIQPLQNLDVIKKVSEDQGEQKKWMQHWINRGLTVYEELIADFDEKFSVSASPTLADLCLIPQVYSSLRWDVDMAKFPRCKSIYELALKTPECAAAHPDRYKPAG
jgi:maleylacetoacetate isomerase